MRRYDSVPLTGQHIGDFGPYDRRPSQMNAYYERALAKPYGRELRGLDGTPSSRFRTDTWAGEDEATNQAADADDTVGNGIFDSPGAPPVQHQNAGIFQASYSEPGYLYRERMTVPSEVKSGVDGKSMLFIPAGGGPGTDIADAYAPFDNETTRAYAAPTRALGDDAAPPATTAFADSWVAWLAGGALVGVAAAYLLKGDK